MKAGGDFGGGLSFKGILDFDKHVGSMTFLYENGTAFVLFYKDSKLENLNNHGARLKFSVSHTRTDAISIDNFSKPLTISQCSLKIMTQIISRI